jgi:hypothetical protein
MLAMRFGEVLARVVRRSPTLVTRAGWSVSAG